MAILLLAFSSLKVAAQTATTTTVTSSNNPSCDNENITLTATVTPSAAAGTVEFFLDGVSLGPPTALVGGVRSLTISSPPTGTYSITAVYTPSNPANFSNSTSAPLSQVVNGSPAVNAITGTTSVCSGSTTTLSDATPGGVWSSNNTSIATVNASGVVTGVSAGSADISYTVTSANGCVTVVTKTVTVTQAATVTPGGPNSVCRSATPSALTLSGASVGGGATTGAWSITSGGGTLSSTAQTASPGTVTYTPAANFSGTVTLTLTSNAVGACPAVSATRTITVNASPTLNNTYPANSTDNNTNVERIGKLYYPQQPYPGICSGDLFTYTPTSATSGATFTWTRANVAGVTPATGSGSGGIAETLTNSTTNIINVVYAITITANGCSNTQNVTLAVGDLPVLTSTLTPSPICSGSTFSYTPTYNGDVGDIMNWTRPSITGINGGASGSGTGNVNEVLTNTTGAPVVVTYIYSIQDEVENGPGKEAAFDPCSNTQYVTVTVNVPATVTPGGPDNVCQSATPSAITLSGASVGGSATTGAWSIVSGGGSLSSTAQTASPATVTYTPAANFTGTVTLRLTTNTPANGCASANATRTITVSPTATVTPGGPNTVCQSATPAAITLTGASVGGSATTGAWSITSGGGTLSSIAQTATPAVVTYTPAANFSGTVTLTLTTNAPTSCPAVSGIMTITVSPTATVTPGGPNTVC
ncbi:MAG: Ig-like domain repeat protein, partial [Niastella sp.]|uniref:Ig-like domain repeat protein n=1 Tax=Niastella sp. TaxID=1869183 RepID=UPI00389AB032